MTEESNLVSHARRELELIGEDPDTIRGYLNIVQAFADMGHSGGSASVAIPVIHKLLQFENLSPLTDDPDEWLHVAEEQWGSPGGIWQSRRRGEAFSNDGGKTYYLLSEGGSDTNRRPLRVSEPKNKDLRQVSLSDGLTGYVCALCKQPPDLHTVHTERIVKDGREGLTPTGWDCPGKGAPRD